MKVDPFLFLAQALNFLILVAVLRRVLYGPVLRLIDEREKAYRKREDEVVRLGQEAEARLQECRHTAEELEQRRARMLLELEAEASSLRRDLEERMRAQVAEERSRRMVLLQQELEGLVRAAQNRLGATLLQTCRRCLEDLADRSLEEQVARHLLEGWAEVKLPANGEVVVRSAFPLSEEMQARFRRVVGATTFATDPELGFGVEVESGGRLAGWALSSYLESLERDLAGSLREVSDGPA